MRDDSIRQALINEANWLYGRIQKICFGDRSAGEVQTVAMQTAPGVCSNFRIIGRRSFLVD